MNKTINYLIIDEWNNLFYASNMSENLALAINDGVVTCISLPEYAIINSVTINDHMVMDENDSSSLGFEIDISNEELKEFT